MKFEDQEHLSSCFSNLDQCLVPVTQGGSPVLAHSRDVRKVHAEHRLLAVPRIQKMSVIAPLGRICWHLKAIVGRRVIDSNRFSVAGTHSLC